MVMAKHYSFQCRSAFSAEGSVMIRGSANGGSKQWFEFGEQIPAPRLNLNFTSIKLRTRSTTTRDRNLQFRGAVSTGGSPLDFLVFLQYLCAISKTSPLKSGESSEKSSGENRVKSCHVCGCHGFFGPDKPLFRLFLLRQFNLC